MGNLAKNSPALSVVIPGRNEEAVLEATLSELHGKLQTAGIDFEIVVVDDHSTDSSRELLARLSTQLPRMRWVSNTGRPGFGMAIRFGIDNVKGDAVAIYMADASDTPEDLILFFRKMEETGADCVFGSRFVAGSRVVDYPQLKLTLNRLANLFIRLMFQIRYNDVTNAFKLYRRKTLIGLQPYLSVHFNLTVELPLKAIVRGYRYEVLPNSWINRKAGVSKLKIQEMGSRYLFIVLYCFIERWLSRGDYLESTVDKKKSAVSRR